MNFGINCIVCIFLSSIGFHFYWSEMVSTEAFMSMLVLGGLLLSALVGSLWFKRIREHLVKASFPLDTGLIIDEILTGNLKWLQSAKPKRVLVRSNICDDYKSSLIYIKTYFMSSYLFVIGMTALVFAAMIYSNSYSFERGIFGSILKSNIGIGLSLMLMVYLGISSLSFFFTGLFAFLFKGDTQ